MVRNLTISIISLFFVCIVNDINGQITARNFTLSYANTLKGGISTFGNIVTAAYTNNTPDLLLMNETSNANNGQGV
jgi:hypothetical protein